MKCFKCSDSLISKEDTVVVNWIGLGNSLLSQFNAYHKQCFENFKGKDFVRTMGPKELAVQKIWNYIILILLGVSPWFLILSQHLPLGPNLITIIFVIIDAIVIIMTVRSLIFINRFQKLPDTK